LFETVFRGVASDERVEAIRHYYVYFDEANLKNYFVGKLN